MNKLNKKIKKNRGMTYVELIVVLSIFAIMSSIVVFNYGAFQDKVDIKNLASDIALQIVQAQKSSISGILPPLSQQSLLTPDWKPSYGVYFTTTSDINADNKNFIYFTDLNNNALYDGPGCTGECLTKITVTKNNIISAINLVGTGCPTTVNNLTVVFKRPNSGALITSNPALSCSINSAQITITSPRGGSASITVYPSGRVQIN